MTATTYNLASGLGWRVDDVVCTAGPCDRPFEERHDSMCIALVSEGTFQYRASHGAATMVPGALLLGNHGQCFECGHDHAAGDRCIAFHYTPEFLETVAADIPGVRSSDFSTPHLPPLPSFMPLVALAEAAREGGELAGLEELALRLAGAVTATLANASHDAPPPSRRDERRIAAALRRIEADASQLSRDRLSLAALAREAAMSPYHFLRSFRCVAGMTPHQYVLRTRLHRAAVRLRTSREPISSIAYDAGFNDLSTFNRRFRRIMGKSPGGFRTARDFTPAPPA